MTNQNIFRAIPANSEITGFIFINIETYKAEFDHRRALFGTKEYELQAISGNQIDQELFAKLKINQATLTDWFSELQHLTDEEKVGLWFLVGCCGYELPEALEVLQDGLTIYHGTKKEPAGLSPQWHLLSLHNAEAFFHEFRFAGETWCGSPVIY